MATPEKPVALAAEATEKMVLISYGGKSYKILPGEEWDIAVLEAAEEGKIIEAMRTLLGPEQWATFREKHTKVKDIKEFFEAAQEVTGGNS